MATVNESTIAHPSVDSRRAEPVVVLVVFGHRQLAIAPVEVFGEGQVFGVPLLLVPAEDPTVVNSTA